MNSIRKHLSQVGEGMTLLDETEIEMAIHVIRLVKARQGTLYLFGNGGSHATASHFANDLAKMARVRAVCVGDLTPIVTAYGNDEGWANMFSSHIEQVIKSVDGVVGISCGGESQNVISGLDMGLRGGALGIGMTGLGNETLINKLGLDTLIHARVPDIRVQEDLHSIACHAIVRSLQENEE